MNPAEIDKLYASTRRSDIPQKLEGRSGPSDTVRRYREFLAERGEYDPRTDAEITLFLGDHYRANDPQLSMESSNPQFSDDYLDLDLQRQDGTMFGELGSGLNQATRGMVGSFSGAYGMTGLPGHESAWEWGVDVQTNAPRASVRRIEDVFRNNGISLEAAALYAPNALGQVIPSLVEGIGMYFVGASTAGTGAAAYYGAKKGTQEAVKMSMRQALRKSMSKKIQKSGAKYGPKHPSVRQGIAKVGDEMSIEDYAADLWRARGGVGASSLNSLAMNSGEVYNSLREEGFSHEESQAPALAYGSLAGGADSVIPAWVGRSFLKKAGIMGQSGPAKQNAVSWLGKQVDKLKESTPGKIGLGVVGEGITEAFQELTNIAAVAHTKGEDVVWDDATKSRLLNASVLGMVGGLGAGVAVAFAGEGPDGALPDESLPQTDLPVQDLDAEDTYGADYYNYGTSEPGPSVGATEGSFVVFTGASGERQFGRVVTQNGQQTTIEPAIGMDWSTPIPQATEFGPEVTVATETVLGSPSINELKSMGKVAQGEEVQPDALPVEEEVAAAPSDLAKKSKGLLSFLSGFGIEVREANALIIDLAKREIGVDFNKTDQVASALSSPLSRMLAFSDFYYALRSQLIKGSHFKKAFEKIRKAHGKPLGIRHKARVEREIITKQFEALLKSRFEKRMAAEFGLDSSIIQKVKQFIKDVLYHLKDTDLGEIKKVVDEVVDNTFEGKDFIRVSKSPKGKQTETGWIEADGIEYERVDFQTAFDQNSNASRILNAMREKFVLTGSIAYSAQGSIYRPVGADVVHDLDFVSDGTQEEGRAFIKKAFPGAKLMMSFGRKDRVKTDTFLVPPEGYSIGTLLYSGRKITGYTIKNSEGKVVGKFKKDSESASGFSAIDQKFNEGEALMVDIFTGDKPGEVVTQSYTDSEGNTQTVNLSAFSSGFESKLAFNRFKDIWDYNRFVPNRIEVSEGEVVTTEGDPTEVEEATPTAEEVTPTTEEAVTEVLIPLEEAPEAEPEKEPEKAPKKSKAKLTEDEAELRATRMALDKLLERNNNKVPSPRKVKKGPRKGKSLKAREKYDRLKAKIAELEAKINGKPPVTPPDEEGIKEVEIPLEDPQEPEESKPPRLTKYEKVLHATIEEARAAGYDKVEDFAWFETKEFNSEDSSWRDEAERQYQKGKVRSEWTRQKRLDAAKKAGIDAVETEGGNVKIKSKGSEDVTVSYAQLELVEELRDAKDYRTKVKEIFSSLELEDSGTSYKELTDAIKAKFPEVGNREYDPNEFWTTAVADDILTTLSKSKRLGSSGNLTVGDKNLRNLVVRNNFQKPHHDQTIEHTSDGVPDSRQWVWITTQGHRALKIDSLDQQVKISNSVSASSPQAAMEKLRQQIGRSSEEWQKATDGNSHEDMGLLVMAYADNAKLRRDYYKHRGLHPSARDGSYIATDLNDGRGKRQVGFIVSRTAPNKNGKTRDMVMTYSGRRMKLKDPTGAIVTDPLSVEVPTPNHMIPVVAKKNGKDPEYAGVQANFPDGIDVAGQTAEEIRNELNRISKGGSGAKGGLNLLSNNGNRYLTRAGIVLLEEKTGKVYFTGLTDHTSGDKRLRRVSDKSKANGLGVQNFQRAGAIDPRPSKNNAPALLEDVIAAGFNPVKVIRLGKMFERFGMEGTANRNVDTLAGYINTQKWSNIEDFNEWFDGLATTSGKIRQSLKSASNEDVSKNHSYYPLTMKYLLDGQIPLAGANNLGSMLHSVFRDFEFTSGKELSNIQPFKEIGSDKALAVISKVIQGTGPSLPIDWDGLYNLVYELDKYGIKKEDWSDGLIDWRDELTDEVEAPTKINEDAKEGEDLANLGDVWKDRLDESDFKMLIDSGKLEMFRQYLEMKRMLERHSKSGSRKLGQGYVDKFQSKMDEIAEAFGGQKALDAIERRAFDSKSRVDAAPIPQERSPEITRRFNQIAARLLESGVDIDVFAREMDHVDSFLRANNARYSEDGIVQIVIDDLLNPGATNLLGLIHESTHFVLDGLDPLRKEHLLAAVKKAEEYFVERHLDKRRMDMLEAMDAKGLEEYLRDPEEQLVEAVTERLAKGSPVTRGMVADVIRKFKELYYSIAMALAKAGGRLTEKANANLATKYLENRMRQWIAADRSTPPPLVDYLNGPTWTGGEHAGILREVRDPHHIPDFLDAYTRGKMRNIELAPTNPLAIKTNRENASSLTDVRYTQSIAVGTNDQLWADAGGVESLRDVSKYVEDDTLDGLLRDLNKVGIPDPNLVILPNAEMQKRFPGRVAAYHAAFTVDKTLANEKPEPTIFLSKDFAYAAPPANETEKSQYLKMQRSVLAELVSHELTHHITHSVFEARNLRMGEANPRLKKFSNQIYNDWDSLLNYVRKRDPKHAPMIYGLTSVEEFVSAWRTDPNFQSYLKSVPLSGAMADKFGVEGGVWDALRLVSGRVLTPNQSAHALAGALFTRAIENGSNGRAKSNLNPTELIHNPKISAHERLIFGHTAMQVHSMIERIPQLRTKQTLNEALAINIEEEVEIDGAMVPAHYVQAEEGMQWGVGEDPMLVPGKRYLLAYPRSQENKTPPISEAVHPHTVLTQGVPDADELIWRIYRTPSFKKYFGDWQQGHQGIKGEEELPPGEVQYFRSEITNEPVFIWHATSEIEGEDRSVMKQVGVEERLPNPYMTPGENLKRSPFSSDFYTQRRTGQTGNAGEDTNYAMFATRDVAPHLTWKASETLSTMGTNYGSMLYTALGQRYFSSYLETLQDAAKTGSLKLNSEFDILRNHYQTHHIRGYNPTPVHLTTFIHGDNNLAESEVYNVPAGHRNSYHWTASQSAGEPMLKKIFARAFYVPTTHVTPLGNPKHFESYFHMPFGRDSDVPSISETDPRRDQANADVVTTKSKYADEYKHGVVAMEDSSGRLTFFKLTEDPTTANILKSRQRPDLATEGLNRGESTYNSHLILDEETGVIDSMGMRQWTDINSFEGNIEKIEPKEFAKVVGSMNEELDAKIPEILDRAERVLSSRNEVYNVTQGFRDEPKPRDPNKKIAPDSRDPKDVILPGTWEWVAADVDVPLPELLAANNVDPSQGKKKIHGNRLEIIIPRDHGWGDETLANHSIYTETSSMPILSGGYNPLILNEAEAMGASYDSDVLVYSLSHMLNARLPTHHTASSNKPYDHAFDLSRMWNLGGYFSHRNNIDADGKPLQTGGLEHEAESSLDMYDPYASLRLPVIGLPSARFRDAGFGRDVIGGETTDVLSIDESVLKEIISPEEGGKLKEVEDNLDPSNWEAGKGDEVDSAMTDILGAGANRLDQIKLPSGRVSIPGLLSLAKAFRRGLDQATVSQGSTDDVLGRSSLPVVHKSIDEALDLALAEVVPDLFRNGYTRADIANLAGVVSLFAKVRGGQAAGQPFMPDGTGVQSTDTIQTEPDKDYGADNIESVRLESFKVDVANAAVLGGVSASKVWKQVKVLTYLSNVTDDSSMLNWRSPDVAFDDAANIISSKTPVVEDNSSDPFMDGENVIAVGKNLFKLRRMDKAKAQAEVFGSIALNLSGVLNPPKSLIRIKGDEDTYAVATPIGLTPPVAKGKLLNNTFTWKLPLEWLGLEADSTNVNAYDVFLTGSRRNAKLAKPAKISLYEGSTAPTTEVGGITKDETPETIRASAMLLSNVSLQYLKLARASAGYTTGANGESVSADSMVFGSSDGSSITLPQLFNGGDKGWVDGIASPGSDHIGIGIPSEFTEPFADKPQDDVDAFLAKLAQEDPLKLKEGDKQKQKYFAHRQQHEGMLLAQKLIKLHQDKKLLNVDSAPNEHEKFAKKNIKELADRGWINPNSDTDISETTSLVPGLEVENKNTGLSGLLVSVKDNDTAIVLESHDESINLVNYTLDNPSATWRAIPIKDLIVLDGGLAQLEKWGSVKKEFINEPFVLEEFSDAETTTSDKSWSLSGILPGTGASDGEIWEDPQGNKIVRKTYDQPFKATAESLGSQIASYLTDGLAVGATDVIRPTDSNPTGEGVNEQKFHEDFKDISSHPSMDNDWRNADVSEVTPWFAKDNVVILDLLKHLVADYIINNRDNHAGNFGISKGRVLAIDKGQAFKFNEAVSELADRRGFGFTDQYQNDLRATPEAIRDEAYYEENTNPLKHFIEHQFDWKSANPRLIYPALRDIIFSRQNEGGPTVVEVMQALAPVIARADKLSSWMGGTGSEVKKLFDPHKDALGMDEDTQWEFTSEISERAEQMEEKVQDLLVYLYGRQPTEAEQLESESLVGVALATEKDPSFVKHPSNIGTTESKEATWKGLLASKEESEKILDAKTSDSGGSVAAALKNATSRGRNSSKYRALRDLQQEILEESARSSRKYLDTSMEFDFLIDRRMSDTADGDQIALPFAGHHEGFGVKSLFSDAFAVEGPAGHSWKYRIGEPASDGIIERTNAFDATQAASNSMLLDSIQEAFGDARRKGYKGTQDEFMAKFFNVNPKENLNAIAERDIKVSQSLITDFDGNAAMTDRTLRFAAELHSKVLRGLAKKKSLFDRKTSEGMEDLQDLADSMSSLSEGWRDATIQEAEAQKTIRKLIKEYVRGMDGQIDLTFAGGKLLGSIKEVEKVLKGEDLSTIYKDAFEKMYDGDVKVFDYIQAMAELRIDFANTSEADIAQAIKTSSSSTLKALSQNPPLMSTLIAFSKEKSLQMALLEARTSRDLDEIRTIDGEIKKVARMSESQLDSLKKEMKGIRKKVSKVYRVRDEYAKVRLKYKRKKNQVDKSRADSKTVEGVLKTLHPRESELHQRLGVGYNFNAAPGEKYFVMEKTKDGWAAREAVYSVAGDDKNRRDIREAKHWNKAYLAEQAALGKQDEPFNKVIADIVVGLSKAVVHREYQTVHMNVLDRSLSTLEQRWRAMGASGVQVARMIAHFRRIQTQHKNESLKLAGAWDGAFSDAIKESGMSRDVFKEMVYDSGIYWIENMPEYADDPDTLYRNVFKEIQEVYRSMGKVASPTLEKSLRKLWSATEACNTFEDNIANANNVLVEDPSVQWSNPLTGKRENLMRRRIKYGRVTVPRMMKGEVLSTINALMRDSGWKDDTIWSEMGRLGETTVDTEAAFQGIVNLANTLMPDTIKRVFLDPLLNKPGDPIFTGPMTRGSKVRQPIPQDEISSVWNDSGSDLGTLIKELYLNQDNPTEEINKFAERFIKRLRNVYEMAAKVASKVDTDPLNPNGRHPHRMMDARTNTIFPREWLQYDTYTKVDAGIHIAKLAAVAAFGRDSSTLSAVSNNAKSEVRVSKGEIGVYLNDPVYKSLTTDKERKNFLVSRLGKDGMKRAMEVERNVEEITDLQTDMRNLFMAPGGGFKDMRPVEEAIGFNAGLVLRTPKSGLWSILSGMDFTQRLGFGSLSAKASGRFIYKSIQEAFGSIFGKDGLGWLNLRANESASVINDLRGLPGQHDLTYRELMSNNGVKGSGEGAIKFFRGADGVLDRSIKGYFGKHKNAGASGYTAFTPFSPFSWLNNVFGKAIAGSMIDNWRYVMRRAIRLAERNPAVMTDPNFKITLGNLGLKNGLLGGNERALEYMADAWAERTGESLLDLVQRVRERVTTGQEMFSKEDYLTMYQMAMDDINLEGGIGSTPISYRTNGILRAASPLLRWATAKSNSVHKSLQTQEGRYTINSVLKGMAGISAVTMPIGIAASMLMDEYDEEILGKKSNLREVDPINLLPGFAMYGMLTNRDGQGLGILERLARAGNTYGLGMEAIYGMTAWTDPSQGQRSLGIDRVLMYSQLSNFRDAFVNIMHSGWYINYEDGKRLFDVMLGQAPAHLAQTVNNTLHPVHEGERRRVKRVDAYNYIRSAGRAAGLPLDKGGVSSAPTPLTSRIRQLMLAAYGDDPEEFNIVLQSAMEAASIDHDGDPMDRIIRSWKARDPLDLFTHKLDDLEMEQLFSHMTERGRTNVMDLIRLHDKYLRYLEPNPRPRGGGGSIRFSNPYENQAARLTMMGL